MVEPTQLELNPGGEVNGTSWKDTPAPLVGMDGTPAASTENSRVVGTAGSHTAAVWDSDRRPPAAPQDAASR